MDSFTQIALGATVAHLTLPKQLGKHCLWIGAVWGTIPDLDVWLTPLIFSDNPLAEVQYHRGFSHSILFFAFFSMISTGLITKISTAFRAVSYKKWFLSFFLILLTHSLLDIFTTWGTQLLWPLPYKFDLHSVFVVDPLYTFPLLLGLIFYYKKDQYKYLNAGVLLSSAYLLLGLIIQNRIENKIIEHLEKKGETIISITVKPTVMNCVLWNVIVETPGYYLINQYALTDSYIEDFQSFKKNHELLVQIPSDLSNQLIDITQGQYIVEAKDTSLYVNDLRFGLLKNEKDDVQFSFSYQLFPNELGDWQVIEVPKDTRDGKKLLHNLWFRLKGN